jgi:hypothetical protein
LQYSIFARCSSSFVLILEERMSSIISPYSMISAIPFGYIRIDSNLAKKY